MKYPAFLVLIVCMLSCSISKMVAQKDDGTFNSILIGKKISESPLQKYIKKDVLGDQFIAVIAYGCSHCIETTSKIIKLKKDKLIDDFIILGSEAGEDGTKKVFLATFPADEKLTIIDYDWLSLPRKFIDPEPAFPNPPVVFFIHNNTIQKVFSELPSSKALKRLKAQVE